jgi:hypothetical protein
MAPHERTPDQDATYGSIKSQLRAQQSILDTIGRLPQSARELAVEQGMSVASKVRNLEEKILVMDADASDLESLERVQFWLQRCTRFILEGLFELDKVHGFFDISECIDPAVQDELQEDFQKFYAAVNKCADDENSKSTLAHIDSQVSESTSVTPSPLLLAQRSPAKRGITRIFLEQLNEALLSVKD